MAGFISSMLSREILIKELPLKFTLEEVKSTEEEALGKTPRSSHAHRETERVGKWWVGRGRMVKGESCS